MKTINIQHQTNEYSRSNLRIKIIMYEVSISGQYNSWPQVYLKYHHFNYIQPTSVKGHSGSYRRNSMVSRVTLPVFGPDAFPKLCLSLILFIYK